MVASHVKFRTWWNCYQRAVISRPTVLLLEYSKRGLPQRISWIQNAKFLICLSSDLQRDLEAAELFYRLHFKPIDQRQETGKEELRNKICAPMPPQSVIVVCTDHWPSSAM